MTDHPPTHPAVDPSMPMTRGESVAQHLRREILSGALPPGAPVRDAELAARLGVSITPVRESVATLVAEGLIEALPNKRRRVAVLTQRQAEELSDVMGLLMVAALGRLPLSRLPLSRLPLSRTGTPDDGSARSPAAEVSAAARHMAAACRSEARDVAEPAFHTFVSTLIRATGHTELIRIADPALRRTLTMFRQYPVEPLLPTWAEGLDEITGHLDDLDAAETAPAAEAIRSVAAARFAHLLTDLQHIIRSDGRAPEDVVALPAG